MSQHSYSVWRKRREANIKHFLMSAWFRIPITFLIGIDLLAVILQSFSSMAGFNNWFNLISVLSAVVFTVEYVLRIIAAPAVYPHINMIRARIRYITSFLGLVDLICIAPFVFSYIFQGEVLRDFIDLARILLIFKLLRYSASYQMVLDVLRSVRYEMITAFTFSAVIVCFAAILMYYIERRAQPDVFNNVGEGFWWAIITFTTVGYGDVVPITPLGKTLAGFIAIIGIITLMLPTGIVSGALMNRLQQQKKDSTPHAQAPETEGNTKSKKCPHCGKDLP